MLKGMQWSKRERGVHMAHSHPHGKVYTGDLDKQFRDALCLRFGWTPERLPSHCPHGGVFSVDHAFSCPKGALLSIRHNQDRDITAQLLTEVCPNVGIEPNCSR